MTLEQRLAVRDLDRVADDLDRLARIPDRVPGATVQDIAPILAELAETVRRTRDRLAFG
jgi:hypothetical protein